MSTLTHIQDVLDAPKRAQQALRVTTARRLQTLELAEATVAQRSRDCDVREAVFRRALDAGLTRGSEAWLRKWVDTELLPSLPQPTAVAVLAADMEERAAELDAYLIELQERELLLRHERDMLQLKTSEVRVREEEVERRVRASAALASKIETRVDERSKYHLQVQDDLHRELRHARLVAIHAQERASRVDVECKWSDWARLRQYEACQLRLLVEEERRNIKSVKNVLERWRRKPPEPPGGASGTGEAYAAMAVMDIDRSFPLLGADLERKASAVSGFATSTSDAPWSAEGSPSSLRAQSTEAGVQHDARGADVTSVGVQTSFANEVPPSGAVLPARLPPSYDARPHTVVLPAFDTEGDLFDPNEEAYRQQYRVEAARIEGLQRATEARLATREAELNRLYDYLQAQRREVDEVSAHLLLRSAKILEVEASQRRAAEQLRGRHHSGPGSVSEEDEDDNVGTVSANHVGDDELGRTSSSGFRVHPLLTFGRRPSEGPSADTRWQH